jgi:hypothetical protein
MFPRPDRPTRSAHGWLEAIRHGLDLVVAFATLRDAETPLDARETAPADRAAQAWGASVVPPATAAARRRFMLAAEARDTTSAGRATGSAAPAAGSAARRATPPPPHPHRRPLRAVTRPRRPGGVRPEPQPCLTPLVARRARHARTAHIDAGRRA